MSYITTEAAEALEAELAELTAAEAAHDAQQATDQADSDLLATRAAADHDVELFGEDAGYVWACHTCKRSSGGWATLLGAGVAGDLHVSTERQLETMWAELRASGAVLS